MSLASQQRVHLETLPTQDSNRNKRYKYDKYSFHLPTPGQRRGLESCRRCLQRMNAAWSENVSRLSQDRMDRMNRTGLLGPLGHETLAVGVCSLTCHCRAHVLTRWKILDQRDGKSYTFPTFSNRVDRASPKCKQFVPTNFLTCLAITDNGTCLTEASFKRVSGLGKRFIWLAVAGSEWAEFAPAFTISTHLGIMIPSERGMEHGATVCLSGGPVQVQNRG